jgi:hypothetical protein
VRCGYERAVESAVVTAETILVGVVTISGSTRVLRPRAAV